MCRGVLVLVLVSPRIDHFLEGAFHVGAVPLFRSFLVGGSFIQSGESLFGRREGSIVDVIGIETFLDAEDAHVGSLDFGLLLGTQDSGCDQGDQDSHDREDDQDFQQTHTGTFHFLTLQN